MPRKLSLAVAPLVAAAVAAAGPEGRMNYPPTKTVDVTDPYHGTDVPDPYRWLEDDVRKSGEVAAWVAAQNAVTKAYLDAIPERDAIRKRVTALWDYEKYSAPFRAGGRYFFAKNDGLQNQAVVYTQPALDADPRVLLDPNAWSPDGTVALSGLELSDDGRYAAYGVADAGSDWNTWKVLDVSAAEPLADELKWLKFTSVSWTPDGRGFFYSRFPAPPDGAAFQTTNENQKLYYHRLGAPQADDVLVYHRPDHPKWTMGGAVTEDGRYLVISVGEGTTSDKNRVAYKDLAEPYGLPADLADTFADELDFVGNDGPVFYFRTDRGAPKKKVVAVDTRDPAPDKWTTVVPEADDVLTGVRFVGNQFVCIYLKDARTAVKLYTPAGKFVRDVELPGIGTAAGFAGKRTDTETFYTFTSFTTPPRIYRYDLITGQSTLFRQAKVAFDPDRYAVEQVFYASKDGTKVPMFVAHKKDLQKDGSHPTLLYGYGGFNISITPTFSISRLQWLEMGGVLAVANLRGGGEYGETWHRAGTKLNKQNVFDDFVAAAEYLVGRKYTSPKKLAIQGGSNGGLLVGACLTQRPDLFGAALPIVGVMDMLRFQRFTAGRFWVDDYGSSDDADEFRALFKYSPYHALLRNGPKDYPATLVLTADTDDRVVPGHSFKFLAALQANQAGGAPVLGRIEARAGHGAGKPTAKLIDEVADQWAFLVKALGFEPAIPD